MSREEAIKTLKENVCGICAYCMPFDACDMSYCDNREAIKALEQEPKTVLYSGDGYADGEMVYDMAECPNCGYEYEDGDKDWGEPYCPHCGQHLKWESEG